MYSKGGKNSRGEKYYVYNEFEHSAEMDNIENLLFVPCISPINALTDDEIAELDYLFNDTVCDLHSDGGKTVLSEEEAWELFA